MSREKRTLLLVTETSLVSRDIKRKTDSVSFDFFFETNENRTRFVLNMDQLLLTESTNTSVSFVPTVGWIIPALYEQISLVCSGGNC